MQKDLMAVKKEEDRPEPSSARPRTTKGKGKGKEPVSQTTREQASDAPGDEVMADAPEENYEHLFGTFEPLTVTNCIFILMYNAVESEAHSL